MTAPSDDDRDRISMARLTEGQEAGLDDLMERHGKRLLNYLVRSLQDEDEATDLAQETFVRVYQNRARFDARHKFSTWLYTIASNLVRDRYRWRARHPQVSLDAQNEESGTGLVDRMADASSTPSDSLQSSERAEAVRRAVAALPEELRQPLILAEWEDKAQAEIAAILGCTVKAVETRIYRARKQLRETLVMLLERG